MKRIAATAGLFTLFYCGGMPAVRAEVQGSGDTAAKLYNTAKQKLNEGKTIVGATVTSFDPKIYCAVANAGFDYVVIDMQHSTLSYADAAQMIFACRGAQAMPFIRVPAATESDIQKATDIGALGIVVPNVDTPDNAAMAVRWTRYPPAGQRSQGTGQARALWGEDYRRTFNQNILVVAAIETPAGAKAADRIAAVSGVDVILAGSIDTSSDSDEIVATIEDAALKAGKTLAGPLEWKTKPGYQFLLGPTDVELIRTGAQKSLKIVPSL